MHQIIVLRHQLKTSLPTDLPNNDIIPIYNYGVNTAAPPSGV